MQYKITVVRYEDNPNYEAQMAEFKESMRNSFRYNNDKSEVREPQLKVPVRTLEVILNEQEYIKVKEAVVSEFK